MAEQIDPATGDVSLACASLLVDELVRGGLAAACISPGSRSTPIALAFARHGDVPVHVHLDERSSAFFALGIAKATRRPVAVVCTSGTAAANFLPATVEASYARAALILCTADRPPELRGTGANQTIDQVGLYGSYVRWSVDAEAPGPRSTASYWRALGARAAVAALGPPAGPVHLNLPFREPLVPTGIPVELSPGEDDDAARSFAETGSSPASSTQEGSNRRRPRPEDVDTLAALVEATERGVIVAGGVDEDASPVIDLARAAGWPLLAEPTSGLRRPGAALRAGQALVADERFAAAHRPDVVLQVGATPTTRAALGLGARAGRLVVVEQDGAPASAGREAWKTAPGSLPALARALLGRITLRGETAWSRSWDVADADARAALDTALDSFDEPFEGRVARDLAALLPGDAVLFAGSSMPIRDLDFFMAPREGLRVLGNRGASGIDGVVSTVLGIASTGVPTFALLGDLTVLHDAGALIWNARKEIDVTVVVLDNGGGGIFDLLPQASLPEHEPLFVTPHGVDFGALARATGIGHIRISHTDDLVSALSEKGRGIRLIEVPVDRARGLRQRSEIRATVTESLARKG